MLALLTDGFARTLRYLLLAALAVGAAYFVAVSIHWQLLSDSAVMHYVSFLMDHGMQPYQDITDNNLPGSYLMESLAMHVFGGSDLSWRIYDYFLLAVMTTSMAAIARRYDWVAGVYAGGYFLLMYGSQGSGFSVEREEVLTTLFLVGYALLFAAVRRKQPLYLLPFGLMTGMASSMKPTFTPLALAVLAAGILALQRRGVGVRRYVGWAVMGLGLALAINLVFLWRHHAIGPFWFVVHTITPAYVGLAQPSLSNLMVKLFPGSMLFLIVCIGVPAAMLDGDWDWERWTLLMGAGFGFVSFVVQHKGFWHHKYLMEAFLLLLLGIELLRGLQKKGWPRLLGATGVVLTIVLIVPHYMYEIHHAMGKSMLTRALERDLEHLGGKRLQGRVQCFDMVFGCLSSLYHLDLMENTGFTGDLLLFFPETGRPSDFYRDKFWGLARRDPADVLVVTNEWFGRPNSFAKMDRWPDFRRYLDANYTLSATRIFQNEYGNWMPAETAPGYRIYVRNGTSLLGDAPVLLLQE